MSEIAKEQGKTFEACYRDIMPVVNFLCQAISIVGQKIEYNKNITFDPDFSDSSSMLFSEPPKKYLDIVRIIAQAEQKNLIDRKQNFIDYEELLSVGIIAVQEKKLPKNWKNIAVYTLQVRFIGPFRMN